MEMKEAYKCERFKVLNVSLLAGETMPLHKASSDVFVINRKGKGKISFADREVVLSEGDSILIKANEPHKMEILENFSSSIILEPDAQINFV